MYALETHKQSSNSKLNIQGMIYNFAQHKFEFYMFVQIAAIVPITFFLNSSVLYYFKITALLKF